MYFGLSHIFWHLALQYNIFTKFSENFPLTCIYMLKRWSSSTIYYIFIATITKQICFISDIIKKNKMYRDIL